MKSPPLDGIERRLFLWLFDRLLPVRILYRERDRRVGQGVPARQVDPERDLHLVFGALSNFSCTGRQYEK